MMARDAYRRRLMANGDSQESVDTYAMAENLLQTRANSGATSRQRPDETHSDYPPERDNGRGRLHEEEEEGGEKNFPFFLCTQIDTLIQYIIIIPPP